jgi:germination protein M
MVSAGSPPPKWSRRPPQADAKSATTGRLFIIALCAFALGFIVYRLWLQPSPPVSSKAPAPAAQAPAAEESGRLVSLFYPLADGSGLSSIIQKRPLCPNETACREDLLLALSENPGAGLFPLLTLPGGPPPIGIAGATATINFRRETIQHLPGGVQSERLVLAALIDTLAVNFPQIQQLSIEIEGVPAETLKGHVDLTSPFVADFSLVRRTLPPSFPVKSGTSSERSQ